MSRPRVILKLATSLDGRIATASGESRWITSEAARAEVQKLRAGADAVLVGIGTALADDPELLARTEPPPRRQPLRVVLDRKLRLPAKAKMLQTAKRYPVVVVSTGGWPEPPRALTEAGARIVLAAPELGESEILTALKACRQSEPVHSVLVEGGGQIAAALVMADLVDRLEWFRAPIALGAEGKAAIGSLALGKLAEAPRWARVAVREIGPDLWESYERAR